jgi:histidine triad (HIT) family protein
MVINHMECIFCKIIEGELPCYKVYEDRRIIAFLDINPVNKGHVLVCPKEHHLNIVDTPVDLLKDIMAVAQRLAVAVAEGVGAKDFNLCVNNGKHAGQIIDHLHFHIIPRFPQDNLHPWPGKTLSDDEMKRVAENIKKLAF